MTREITSTYKSMPQLRDERADSFSDDKRQRFLDALALTCNVVRSARHAGITTTPLYRHRLKDAVFAEQWAQALAMGYDRLEALVLEHGGAGGALDLPDGDRAAQDATLGEAEGNQAPEPIPPFDWDRAFKIMQLYRRDDGRVRSGHRPRTATREETTDALIKALAAAKRRVERSQDDE